MILGAKPLISEVVLSHLVDIKSHARKFLKVTMSKLLAGVISELVLIMLNLDFEIDRS
jgi:hypothetical protein